MSDGISGCRVPSYDEDASKLSNLLMEYAKRNQKVTYQKVMEWFNWDRHQLNVALTAVSEQNVRAAIPLMTSIAVGTTSKKPSDGYWKTVHRLRSDRPTSDKRHEWWVQEVGRVYGFARGMNFGDLDI